MQRVDVLIVGAGPTGLVLALYLTRLGVKVRVVDKAGEPGQTSRAVGVQARTLEFYQQLGIADTVVEKGVPFAAANLWVRGKHQGRVEFGSMGKGLSPYPYMLIFPQDAHEKLLIARLADDGVSIDRPTELVDIAEQGDRVVARLRGADGAMEVCEATYLAGCDGARSRPSRRLAIRCAPTTFRPQTFAAGVHAIKARSERRRMQPFLRY